MSTAACPLADTNDRLCAAHKPNPHTAMPPIIATSDNTHSTNNVNFTGCRSSLSTATGGGRPVLDGGWGGVGRITVHGECVLWLADAVVGEADLYG